MPAGNTASGEQSLRLLSLIFLTEHGERIDMAKSLADHSTHAIADADGRFSRMTRGRDTPFSHGQASRNAR